MEQMYTTKREVGRILVASCAIVPLQGGPFRMIRVHKDDGQSMVAEVPGVGFTIGIQVFFDWLVTGEQEMRVRLVFRERGGKRRSELLERHEQRFRRLLEREFGAARYCPHNGYVPQWAFPVPSSLLTAPLTEDSAAGLFERVLRCIRQAGTPAALGF